MPISEGENTHTHVPDTHTTLSDICLRCGTARQKQRLCVRTDRKHTRAGKHMRDRQRPQRESKINSRRHGNRAVQQKTASSGKGWGGCCYGFNE